MTLESSSPLMCRRSIDVECIEMGTGGVLEMGLCGHQYDYQNRLYGRLQIRVGQCGVSLYEMRKLG